MYLLLLLFFLSKSSITSIGLDVNAFFICWNIFFPYFHFSSFLTSRYKGVATLVKSLMNCLQQLASPRNFYTSFMFQEVSQFNTFFTFSFCISTPLEPITTPKNSISLTFHLYFSGFTNKSFFFNHFNTFSTISLYFFFVSVVS